MVAHGKKSNNLRIMAALIPQLMFTEEDLPAPATLCAAGETIHAGTFGSCLREWCLLSADMRRDAHIQPARAICGRRVFKFGDIAGIFRPISEQRDRCAERG
jgi:hypothetical protein